MVWSTLYRWRIPIWKGLIWSGRSFQPWGPNQPSNRYRLCFGCSLYNKEGIDRIFESYRKGRKNQVVCTGQRHQIDCRLCSYLLYTQVFRALKEYSPGPVTFILNANNHLAKFSNPTKREIMWEYHPCGRWLLKSSHDANISISIPLPPIWCTRDGRLHIENYKHKIDVLIHSQVPSTCESTIIDCTSEDIVVVREGKTIIP